MSGHPASGQGTLVLTTARAARPVVGITTYVESAAWGHWQLEAALIPYMYVQAIERAGGTPLLVPPMEEGTNEILDVLDGLLLSGGADLDPELYGATAHSETNGIRPARDQSELALLKGALERDLPVLAVCRGSQILNVARGGDLVQHLPDIVGGQMHNEVKGKFSEHLVRVDPSSKLPRELGLVKSHHHQGFGRIGEGLREVAWADDGTVEAVEDTSRRFALGVLWHPEAGDDALLFDALVKEAAHYRREHHAEAGTLGGRRPPHAGGAPDPTASLTRFVRAYERASNSHDINQVRPFLAPEAVYWFSDGSHRGREAVLAAIAATFAAIRGEAYEIHDLEWITHSAWHAVCRYRFAWTGTIGGQLQSGAGRGTNVLVSRNGAWQIVHEHLSD